MKVSADKLRRTEARVWILIYAGLITLAMGLAIRRTEDVAGAWLAVFGGVLIAAGLVLIWWRSRMTG